MKTGDRVSHGDQIVTIRSRYQHVTTGHVTYLVEFSDGVFARAGAECLAPLDEKPEPKPMLHALGSIAKRFLRQGAKRKVVLK